jgi:hypothetical protein
MSDEDMCAMHAEALQASIDRESEDLARHEWSLSNILVCWIEMGWVSWLVYVQASVRRLRDRLALCLCALCWYAFCLHIARHVLLSDAGWRLACRLLTRRLLHLLELPHDLVGDAQQRASIF